MSALQVTGQTGWMNCVGFRLENILSSNSLSSLRKISNNEEYCREYLLLFGAEYFVFQFSIQKYKD
jgi:uncharacterized protein YutD